MPNTVNTLLKVSLDNSGFEHYTKENLGTVEIWPGITEIEY